MPLIPIIIIPLGEDPGAQAGIMFRMRLSDSRIFTREQER